jgi:hypothetical protein
MITRGAATHEEARELLEALALGALDPAEQKAVLAHVQTCAACETELASLRETVGNLAFAARGPALSDARSDAVRARLLDRARRSKTSALSLSARNLAIAASVLLVVALGSLIATSRQRSALRDALRDETQRAAANAARADSLTQLLATLTGPDVAVVELTSAGTRAPSARMFWDRATNSWNFVAHNMPALASGRTYQLWLVTRDAKKISAGTFEPSASGDALVHATYELPRDALAAVAVTEEPAGGMPQPTGAMVISGTPR